MISISGGFILQDCKVIGRPQIGAGTVLGLSLLLAGAVVTADALAADANAEMRALESRVQRQQDYIDIQNLMSLRSYYHSAGLQAREFELFAHQPDVSLGTNAGFRVGRDHVRASYVERFEKQREERLKQLNKTNPQISNTPENLGIGVFQQHSLATPLIQIAGDGKTAKAMWYSATAKASRDAKGELHSGWSWEKFAVDFIKEDGQWRFWHMLILSDLSLGNYVAAAQSIGGSVPSVPFDVVMPVAQSWNANGVPKLNPPPPQPYRTFSETFSYGAPVAGKQLPQAATTPQGNTRESILALPDWSGTWLGSSTMFNTPGGSAPLTAMALARNQQTKAAADAGEYLVAQERCAPRGMPLVMSGSHAAFEFLFTPGQVTIIPETNEVRRIYTDGRTHPDDPDPSYNGHSIGHWEGATLVVDTIAMLPEVELLAYLPQTGKTQVRERIFKNEDGTLQIDTTVTDADLLTRPWSYTRLYKRSKASMAEFICTQGSQSNSTGYDLTPPK